jgi:hypothetical protein
MSNAARVRSDLCTADLFVGEIDLIVSKTVQTGSESGLTAPEIDLFFGKSDLTAPGSDLFSGN